MKRNACNGGQYEDDDIWKSYLMEKLQFLNQDRSNGEVWNTRLLNIIDALVIEVKLLKYIIRLLCILLVLNKILGLQ